MLHIGGVRTALFSWLYARRMVARSSCASRTPTASVPRDEAVRVILEGMQWLGLTADEGPYYQTQRFDRYREVIARLLAAGHGLPLLLLARKSSTRCARAAARRKEKPRYDGRCRDTHRDAAAPA